MVTSTILNNCILNPLTSVWGYFSVLTKSEVERYFQYYSKKTKQLTKFPYCMSLLLPTRTKPQNEDTNRNRRLKLTFLSTSFGSALRDCERLFTGLMDGARSWATTGKKLKNILKKVRIRFFFKLRQKKVCKKNQM